MHWGYRSGLCVLRGHGPKDRLGYISGAAFEPNAREPALQQFEASKYHRKQALASGPPDQQYRCDQNVLRPSTSFRAVP